MKRKHTLSRIKLLLGIMAVVLSLSGCGNGESNKYKAYLLEQTLTNYGADITIQEAIKNNFEEFSLNEKEINEESYDVVLVFNGKDKNGENWIIDFYTAHNSWQPVVIQCAGEFYSEDDAFTTDLIMRYFATNNDLYIEALESVYSICGIEKSYDIVEIYEGLNASDDCSVYISETAKKFIRYNEELFPIDSSSFIPADKILLDVNTNDVKKNPERFCEMLIPIKNLSIINISEITMSKNEYLTEVIGHDANYDYYHILYCGELDGVYAGDTIAMIALPVGDGFMVNGLGGRTDAIFLLASAVSKSSDVFSLVNDRIVSAEDRYNLALYYVETEGGGFETIGEDEGIGDYIPDDNDPNVYYEGEYVPTGNFEEPVDAEWYLVYATENGYGDDYSYSWRCGFGIGYADAESGIEYYNSFLDRIVSDYIIIEDEFSSGYDVGFQTACEKLYN